MRKNYLNFLYIFTFVSYENIALAYIGPGAGIGMILSALAIIFVIIIFILYLIWLPFKKILSKFKKKNKN